MRKSSKRRRATRSSTAAAAASAASSNEEADGRNGAAGGNKGGPEEPMRQPSGPKKAATVSAAASPASSLTANMSTADALTTADTVANSALVNGTPTPACPRWRAVVPPAFVVFNLTNEPGFRYNLALIADKGFQPHCWTSYRLRSECLYLETNARERFELSWRSRNPRGFSVFQWARVRSPQYARGGDSVASAAAVAPLPMDQVEVIASELDWAELEWGHDCVKVRDLLYKPLTVLFWKPRVANVSVTSSTATAVTVGAHA